MITFKFILQELLDSNFESLRELNPYLLKKFFEFALTDKEFNKRLLNKDKEDFLIFNNKTYNQQNECILMVACITSLSSIFADATFEALYSIYINYKNISTPWRGRNDWYDFHRNIYSHFIWTENVEKILWTWYKTDINVQNILKSNDKVSAWRKNWYQTYQRNLRHFILKLCLIKENISLIIELTNHKIINPKLIQFQKSLFEYGYIYDKDKIIPSEISMTKEWYWIMNKDSETVNLDFNKLYDICNKIPKFKQKILVYLNEVNFENFWNVVFNLESDQIRMLSKLNLKKLLGRENLSKSIFDYNKEDKLISFIFENYKIHKYFTDYFVILLEEYKMNIHQGYKMLKNLLNDDLTIDYDYLSVPCKLLIEQAYEHDISDNKISINQAYWIYHLLGISITNIGNDKHHYTDDVCPICLNNFENHESNYNLVCGHYFHKSCLLTDFNNRRSKYLYNCPMCRSKIHPSSIQLSE